MFLFVVAKVAFPVPLPGQLSEVVLGSQSLADPAVVNESNESLVFYLHTALGSSELLDNFSIHRAVNFFFPSFNQCSQISPLISPRGPPLLA